MVSACLITYNEEELLPRCLDYLNKASMVAEICIVDSNSTDHTMDIIEEFARLSSSKRVWVRQRKFDNFCNQKNEALNLASEPWILIIDADETYSESLNTLMLGGIPSQYNAIRVPTLLMLSENLYSGKIDTDPHVRLFKNGFARFEREVHELLHDKDGRCIHTSYAPDILTLSPAHGVWMKHWQLLKSDKSLMEKGERWESLGMIEASFGAGIPLTKEFWLKAKYNERASGVRKLPADWR